MTEILAPAFLTLSAVIVLWDIMLAGSISQVRGTPPGFAALTALSGLLIAPALLIAVASSSILTGRAIYVLAWVWPATLLVFATQAAYTAARHMVTPLVSLPIFVYDLLLAVTAFVRLSVYQGSEPAEPLLALVATQALVPKPMLQFCRLA